MYSIKLAMISGSYPPDTCGVGDYTARLVETLRDSGIDVRVFSSYKWNLLGFSRLYRKLSYFKPDVIHIQYPTVGYGKGILPQLLSLAIAPCVVTLHEVSQVHVLRRLSLYPFALGAERLIFTSDYEMNYALKWAPWLANRSSVIPIGSFISTPIDACEKDLDDIVYFGLIRPKKGLEQVIRLAYLAKSEGVSLSVRIIGSVDSKQQPYLDQLQSASAGLPIRWELGLPEPQVANLLARSRIAYMPFPDGASERRSSLLALLLNGVATVSTKGAFTTGAMADAIAFAETPEEALHIVKGLMAAPEKQELLAQKARRYARRHGWDSIASRHLELYREVLQHTQPTGQPR